ncbi:MAG: rhomboid family intramembrane serine protease [Methylothermaceae bacteria B42]|nr:MAG: rhomboid family intramembrane serine protease [Methylothermaceae bacteria B42]HHJ39823.1 rhomboid family intramembrane serine protease [Methylothermaceae bacterium]
MFPIRDENPVLRTPIATIFIIILNVLVWAGLQGFGQPMTLLQSLCDWALIPGELFGKIPEGEAIPLGPNVECVLENRSPWLTIFTSMFMHGSWFHLIANMWFLWIFGDNVEDAMGSERFIVFYLLCGLAAAAAQILGDPSSTIPMVGASGAIGGVMGAYARLYPNARVENLVFMGYYVTTIALPAYVMLGYWFLIQIFSGMLTDTSAGGVAFWAHAGGFLAGIYLAGLMHRPDYLAEHLSQTPKRQAKHRW